MHFSSSISRLEYRVELLDLVVATFLKTIGGAEKKVEQKSYSYILLNIIFSKNKLTMRTEKSIGTAANIPVDVRIETAFTSVRTEEPVFFFWRGADRRCLMFALCPSK